jgi:hypothetical protein
MNEIYNILPKDLCNIVEEYAKDRTNYDIVINELNTNIKNFSELYNKYFIVIKRYPTDEIMNFICSDKSHYDTFLYCFLHCINND